MNTFVKFSNFMTQDGAFDCHCRFLLRAFVQNVDVAVTYKIDSHITISYFSVGDPDEIILDEEDHTNDPFIHVNMKDIRSYSKEHLQQ